MIGQTFSHYRIINRIGAGGMGEVYLAEDARLGRKLAIKLLPEQFTQDADRVRRFEQEARAASALNHPNIITIYDIGKHEQTHFIATEYIEGETLRERMNKQRLKIAEVLDVATGVASALATPVATSSTSAILSRCLAIRSRNVSPSMYSVAM